MFFGAVAWLFVAGRFRQRALRGGSVQGAVPTIGRFLLVHHVSPFLEVWATANRVQYPAGRRPISVGSNHADRSIEANGIVSRPKIRPKAAGARSVHAGGLRGCQPRLKVSRGRALRTNVVACAGHQSPAAGSTWPYSGSIVPPGIPRLH